MAKHKVGMAWLKARMEELGLRTLEEAAQVCSMNRGTLYRYLTFEQRPSIDAIPGLCEGLQVAPLELLRALKIQV
jgi:transcriptional regulator with XRE-family HTH domain